MRSRWPEIVEAVRRKGPRIASLLDGAHVEGTDGDLLSISLDSERKFQKDQLEGPHRRTIEAVVEAVLGWRFSTRYVLEESGEGRQASGKRVQDDPAVRKILDTFDGGIVAVNEGNSS